MPETYNINADEPEQSAGLIEASLAKFGERIRLLHGNLNLPVTRIVSDEGYYKTLQGRGTIPSEFLTYKLTAMRPDNEAGNQHVTRRSGSIVGRTDDGVASIKAYWRPVIIDLSTSFYTIDFKTLMWFMEQLMLRDDKLSADLIFMDSPWPMTIIVDTNFSIEDADLEGDIGARMRLNIPVSIKTQVAVFVKVPTIASVQDSYTFSRG